MHLSLRTRFYFDNCAARIRLKAFSNSSARHLLYWKTTRTFAFFFIHPVYPNRNVNNRIDSSVDCAHSSSSHCQSLKVPTIRHSDEILDEMGGVKLFTILDLASGYLQVPLREEDKAKTTFLIGLAHYEFNVMPFGLTNAILQGCEGCLVFIDDIIVFGTTPEEHLQRFDTVLTPVKASDVTQRKPKPSKTYPTPSSVTEVRLLWRWHLLPTVCARFC